MIAGRHGWRWTVSLYLGVALGGAIGSLARAGLSLLAVHLGASTLWATLAANMLGSFVIGLFAALTGPGGRFEVHVRFRHSVMAGFCGGFTTFSVFSLESARLVAEGRTAMAGLYVGGSLMVWLIAVWLGHDLGRRLDVLHD